MKCFHEAAYKPHNFGLIFVQCLGQWSPHLQTGLLGITTIQIK